MIKLMAKIPLKHYWAESKPELLAGAKTSVDGLSQAEAENRLKTLGHNQLIEAKQTRLEIIGNIFSNPLFIVLAIASLVSRVVGENTDAIIILVMILVSAGIDFYQQYHASRVVEKLLKKVSLKTSVIRDGQRIEIPVDQITLGDIFDLESGEVVPADARVIESNNLQVDQSTLTGEPFPQAKSDIVLDETTPLNERTNCVYMGSSIISGEGRAVVVATGSNTEFGKIAAGMAAKKPKTEFEIGITRFSTMLSKVITGLVIFTFITTTLLGHDIFNSFLFALALAVGLTPEFLPMMVTINLAAGAKRLAKKKVIVKDLRSIENFGSMNVLCTDKTGTITEGKISVAEHYDTDGKPNENTFKLAYLNSNFYTGYKDPLDLAILEHDQVDIDGYAHIDDVPFDFERKRLSVIVRHAGESLMITKGSVDKVLEICSQYQAGKSVKVITQKDKDSVHNRYDDLSKQGYRTIALAMAKVPEKKKYSIKDEQGLIFVGLLTFMDPPKESAKAAIDDMRALGVELKILTGDNEHVTRKACEELGIEVGEILTGAEIDHIGDARLKELAPKTTIFARLTPEQKEKVINALRNDDYVVGFMGDGINDGLAFHAADIGISVDNAADVAKEAAHLILLEKDLEILQEGVEDGRKTHGNVMKYIMMNTSSNFGNMFSVAIGSAFLPFLPMLPTQILLNNLLYDVSQLVIPLDHVDKEYLTKPKRWDIKAIKRFMFSIGPVSSIFDLLTFGVLLWVFKASPEMFRTGWFIESLLTQTMIVFAIRTRFIPFWKSRPSWPLTLMTIFVPLFALALVYLPIGLNFEFVHLSLPFIAYLGGVLVAYFILIELFKVWYYRPENLSLSLTSSEFLRHD